MDHVEERRVQRAAAAAKDLRACAEWAAGDGLHLVIDRFTAPRFSFTAEHFPPGTVDARDGDAVAGALGDPTALIVTAGGHYWGMPAGHDPRWRSFLDGGGVYGVLVVSALSGGYYGLHVDGRHTERFGGGVREEPLAVEAVIGIADSSRLEIIRTTLGLSVPSGHATVRCADLAAALVHVTGAITSVAAPGYEDADLAAALERSGTLPEQTVALNGRLWRRQPALVAR